MLPFRCDFQCNVCYLLAVFRISGHGGLRSGRFFQVQGVERRWDRSGRANQSPAIWQRSGHAGLLTPTGRSADKTEAVSEIRRWKWAEGKKEAVEMLEFYDRLLCGRLVEPVLAIQWPSHYCTGPIFIWFLLALLLAALPSFVWHRSFLFLVSMSSSSIEIFEEQNKQTRLTFWNGFSFFSLSLLSVSFQLRKPICKSL